MAAGEILQCFGNFGQDFHRMVGDGVGEAVNSRSCNSGVTGSAESARRYRPARVQSCADRSHVHDAFAFHLVQDLSHLFRRIFVVIQERDESRDRAFEVNVVLPERIVRIDEQVLCSVGFGVDSIPILP